MAKRHASGAIVAGVFERQHALGGDGLLYDVNVAEHAIVLAFHAPAHVPVLFQALHLVLRAQAFDGANERGRLPRRDEAASLHRIDKQKQLGFGERALGKEVAHGLDVLPLNLDACVVQRLEIAIQGLALRGYARCLQLLENLLERQPLLIVGFLEHDLQQRQQTLFADFLRHTDPSRSFLRAHCASAYDRRLSE